VLNFVKIRRCLPELWQCVQCYSFFLGHSVLRVVFSFYSFSLRHFIFVIIEACCGA